MEENNYDDYDDFKLNTKNHNNNKSKNINKTKSKKTKNNNNIYSSKHVRLQSQKMESLNKKKKK